jgi:hypothetical protein
MTNQPVGRRPRSADLHSNLRLAALAAVVAGVVLLAAAAFVLSYEGIHQIALRAGVSPGLAKLYPIIFDVMLVIAAAAALALRGAGWWARCYAWALLLILLAAVAVGNAVHATGTTLPAQPTKAVVAVTPWVLLLMAFGLLLEMLRHFRTTRSTAAKATATAAASASASAGANVNGALPSAAAQAATSGNAAAQAATSGNNVRELPRVDLDTLLGPRAGQPPPIEAPHDTGAGENTDHQSDPVSYGEETGYVHPDSYLDEGEYSPHGDTGGPGSPAGQAGDNAGDGTYLAKNGPSATETPATATETPATPASATATSAETPATLAETPATPAETPATSTPATATPAEVPATPGPATAGEMAPGSENGQASGADRAAVETPAGPEGTAEAGQNGDGVTQEAAGAEGPALERIRSTPTRPEE